MAVWANEIDDIMPIAARKTIIGTLIARIVNTCLINTNTRKPCNIWRLQGTYTKKGKV